MTESAEKYINPFTDYGFKKLFGEELNKDLLLDFLNELLKEEQGQIKDLTYLKTEHLGATEGDRRGALPLPGERVWGEAGEQRISNIEHRMLKFDRRDRFGLSFQLQIKNSPEYITFANK